MDPDGDSTMTGENSSQEDTGLEEQAADFARRLAALSEPEMQERAFVRFIAQTAAVEVTGVLAVIQRRGHAGGPPFDVALTAVARALTQGLFSYETLTRLYEAAKSQGLDTVGTLFFSDDPAAPPERPPDPPRELTLGHRKSLARSHDRDVLQRLLSNPEPKVIELILQNPRITERDLVALAARRPTDPEVQRTILTSPRWIQRYAIKRALILNPYTPLEISLRLLSLMRRTDLRLITQSPTLTARLRQAAQEHLGD
ncbi:MAG: hypothetical protein JRH20_00995 [Deltaproteobacteria bacterium]|nr:hypothetical protein [Deltaproteobacteria bacterium]